MSFAVGVDIGGTSVKIGCWEHGDPLIWRNGLPVPQDTDGIAVAAAIAALIRECLPSPDARPACIGVGTCGMVHRGRILMSPNTPWDEVPLTDYLRGQFGCAVQVLNDADAYLLGVMQDEAETQRIACGFTLGTGLGTAIWLGDRLLGTMSGTSPEGGHITLDMHGEPANTGIPGSFESLCCITAIQRYYLEAGGSNISPEMIATAASNGEQAARDAWFIGFTADYVTGVWMGYDDNTPLTGVTGGGLPAEIWHEVMARVEDGVPPTPLPMANPGDYVMQPDYGVYPNTRPLPQPTQPGRQRPSGTEGFLVDLLGAILRGGN